MTVHRVGIHGDDLRMHFVAGSNNRYSGEGLTLD